MERFTVVDEEDVPEKDTVLEGWFGITDADARGEVVVWADTPDRAERIRRLLMAQG